MLNNVRTLFATRLSRRMIVVSLTITFLLLAGGVAGAQTVPFFLIESVEKDASVTVVTFNLPSNENFIVTMGAFGTLGFGQEVDRFNSAGGGTLRATFPIPDHLKGSTRIAVRIQTAHPNPYFAYNWFYNNTAPVTTPSTAGDAPAQQVVTQPYIGIPTITINAVTRGQTVTVTGQNFPPNQTFTTKMNIMGTRGLNGNIVETFESGAGGSFTRELAIPAQLANNTQIAIRMETAGANPYVAYNWFWNYTTP